MKPFIPPSTVALPVAKPSSKQWLALYFPALALDIFQQQTTPDDHVQVVIEEQRVSHMNQAAAKSGILPGCTLATAHSISPGLTYFERRPKQEQERLEHLAQALYRYSSMVSLEPPNCIVLEVKGSLLLWGDADIIAQDAIALCADMHHSAIARQADTPQAAIALARAQTTRLFDVPLHTLELLNQGFSQRNLERLSNMGIYTLGQLMQLPRAGLGKRFGQRLTQYLGRLQGELPEPRENIRPAKRFSRQQHLLKPISNKDVLLQGPMCFLAKQLEHWLIAHQQGCITLCWRFAPFKGPASKLKIRFGKGKQQHHDLLKLSALQLDNMQLPAEVLTVGLDLHLGQSWVGNNQDLFGSTASAALAASELVDELSARLGANACYSIRAKRQHCPEHAWQGQPGLSAPSQQPARQASSTATAAVTGDWLNTDPAATDKRSAGLLCGQRPLWLFHRPQAVLGKDLVLLQGPERLAGPLANPTDSITAESRDYYVARHTQGALCWVYTNQQNTPTQPNDRWFLHGYFG